jgi:hypothetical protein
MSLSISAGVSIRGFADRHLAAWSERLTGFGVLAIRHAGAISQALATPRLNDLPYNTPFPVSSQLRSSADRAQVLMRTARATLNDEKPRDRIA